MSKTIVTTEKAPSAIGPYNQGTISSGFLFTSGQLPIHPVTGDVPNTIEAQTTLVMDNLKAIIEEAGCTMEDIVKCTVYITNFDNFAVMNSIYAKYFPMTPPARATVGISSLAKGALVEIDAIVAV